MKYTSVFIILSLIIIIICSLGVGFIFYNQNPNRYFLKGESSFESGNYEKAVDALTEYLSYGYDNDNVKKARYYLAASISRKRDYLAQEGRITPVEAKSLDALAKRKFIDVINKNGRGVFYTEAVVGYAEICRREETYDRYITHKLEDIIHSAPDSRVEDKIYMLLGWQYLYTGDQRKAMNCFLQSSEELSKLGQAAAHLDLKQYESAFKIYEDFFNYFKSSEYIDEVKKAYLENVAVWAGMLARGGKHIEAILAWKKIIEHFPLTVDAEKARFAAGESYYALENWDSAKQYYISALEDATHEKDDDSLYKAGLCWYEMGNNLEAYKTFNNLVNQYPRSIYLARSRQWVRQLKKDLEYFQE